MEGVRHKALSLEVVKTCGWKATGLKPLSPITILEKLSASRASQLIPPYTPGQSSSLDLSLLHSSPLEGTELREANIKELTKQRELLQTRKARKTGKRVKLKGRFVFSTQEVLQITKEAKEATIAKKGRKRLRRRSISVEIKDDIESLFENVLSDSKSDCIVVAERRSS
ncbi:hypothetical protein M433DRAFT_159927 [Acidomyces richmondensis BFW]|nr:hypothetical protein M433DRAFT_159927 [Acidomyces richmondensis BFW]